MPLSPGGSGLSRAWPPSRSCAALALGRRAGGRHPEEAVRSDRRHHRRDDAGEKVGQLFVPYVTGGTADTVSAENRTRFGVDTPAQAVAKFHLGGVIYFAWSGNTDNPAQIAGLSNGLQRANTAADNPVPLSVATDQETGLVARIGPPATQSSPAPWPSVRPATRSRPTARRDHRPRAAGDRHQHRLRTGSPT